MLEDELPLLGVSVGLALLVAVLLTVSAVVLTAALQWRRFTEGLGAFPCFVRLPGSAGAASRWRRGAARFDPEALRWFPLYTLLSSRSLVLQRSELELSGRWAPGQRVGVPAGLTMLAGSVRGRAVELALPPASASALVLWAESGPPGRGVNVA